MFKNKTATLIIPHPDVVGQAVQIKIDGEFYLISKQSCVQVSAKSMPAQEYNLLIDATVTLESGHFPNPMVEFKCLSVEKLSFI